MSLGVTFSIDTFSIPQPTNNTEPTGGVILPRHILNISITPNWISVIPKLCAIGRKIGVNISIAGDCIIFPPQTMHRSYSEQGCTFSRIVLYFRPDIISSDALRQKLAASYCVYKSDTESLKMLRRLMYYFLEAQNSASAYKQEQMEALVNLIIIIVLEMKESTIGIERHNRTTQIINYINNNYEHDISLDVLADMFHISTYYLCREFKKNTNRTVVDYIKHTRIMNAERLFKETDKNVTEVATLTGFSNLTHFNRVFKEIAGVNPSQYKKLHAKN